MPAPAFSSADVAAKLREIKRKYLSLTGEQDFLIVSELVRGRQIHTYKKELGRSRWARDIRRRLCAPA